MRWALVLGLLFNSQAFAASGSGQKQAHAAVYFRIVILPKADAKLITDTNKPLPRGQVLQVKKLYDGTTNMTLIDP